MIDAVKSLIGLGKRILLWGLQCILSLFRGVGLSRDVVFSRFSVGMGRRPRIFNLDVHTSVIADLKKGAESLDLSITNWSISGSNRVFRKLLWVPDPVRAINAASWKSIDSKLIEEFTSH